MDIKEIKKRLPIGANEWNIPSGVNSTTVQRFLMVEGSTKTNKDTDNFVTVGDES
jgi:hypothetical protein